VARADQPEVATLKQREADRYRKAADDALQQLDWAIGYLHGIRKVQIALCRAGFAGTEPCSGRRGLSGPCAGKLYKTQ
jgi:hypothetical protein